MTEQQAREIIERERREREASNHSKDARTVENLLGGVLQDLSSERTHFVLEFVQNAVDANAKSIKFRLSPNERLLTIENDGDPFTEQDAVSICDAGMSNKRSKIGYKGIGFKSVVALTDCPQIYSGAFRFGFFRDKHPEWQNRWIVIPHWIDQPFQPLHPRANTTVVLPLKSEAQFREEDLDNLPVELLLFLDQLATIEVEKDEQRITLSKRVDSRRYRGFQLQTLCRKQNGEVREEASYLTLSVPCSQPTEEAVKDYEKRRNKEEAVAPDLCLAFRFDPDRNCFEHPKDKDTFAFLPITERSGLPFVIQSNFIPDSPRKELLHDSAWNVYILSNLPRAFREAVEQFKRNKRLKAAFYDILPDVEKVSDFVRPFAEQSIEELATQEIVLAEDDRTWVKPENAYFASDEIRKLITEDDLHQLTGVENRYASRQIRGRSRDILIDDMGAHELRIGDMLEFVRNEQWMRSKCRDVKWFIRLYAYLVNHAAPLRDAPILLDRNNELHRPSNNEVFVPTKESQGEILGVFSEDVTFLHDKLCQLLADSEVAQRGEQRKQARDFLETLRLPRYDRRSLIDRIIVPAFENWTWQNINDKRLIGYTRFVHDYVKDTKDDPALLQRLRECLRVKLTNGGWAKPEAVYLTKAYGTRYDLERLLQSAPNVYFVSREYLRERSQKYLGQEQDAWRSFFTKMKMEDKPRRFIHEPSSEVATHPHSKSVARWREYFAGFRNTDTWELQSDWKNHRFRHTIAGSVYVEGIDAIADSGDEARWSEMIRLIDENYSYYQDCFRCKYMWRPMNENWQHREISTYFAYVLQRNALVPTTQGVMKPDRRIYIDKPKIREILGDSVPYLKIDIKHTELLKLLGVRQDLTSDDAGHVLLKWKAEGIEDAQHYGRLYESIGKAGCVPAALQDEPFIFVPDGHKKWWFPSEVMWNSEASEFFGNDKAYLQNRYPDSLRYTFKILGVKDQVTADSLVDYLCELPNRENLDPEELKPRLWSIYLKLERLLISGWSWENPTERLRRVKNELLLLTESGQFASLAGGVYVKDAMALYDLFKDEVPFFYAGESWKKVQKLLSVLEVRKISEWIEQCVEITPEMPSPAAEQRATIDKNLEFIECLTGHRFPDREQNSEDMQTLREVKVLRADTLRVMCRLKGSDIGKTVPEEDLGAYYDEERKRILVADGCDEEQLAIAVAQIFSDIYADIKPSLMMLFGKKSEKDKSRLLRQWDIPTDRLPEVPTTETQPTPEVSEESPAVSDDGKTQVTPPSKAAQDAVREEVRTDDGRERHGTPPLTAQPSGERQPPRERGTSFPPTTHEEEGDGEEKEDTATVAREMVKRFEELEGRTVESVEGRRGGGYDFKSSLNGHVVRRIEMKSSRGEVDDISFTETQWGLASELGDEYWLYVVEQVPNTREEAERLSEEELRNRVHPIRNPYKEFGDFSEYTKVTSTTIRVTIPPERVVEVLQRWK